jgi:hypothetical protein
MSGRFARSSLPFAALWVAGLVVSAAAMAGCGGSVPTGGDASPTPIETTALACVSPRWCTAATENATAAGPIYLSTDMGRSWKALRVDPGTAKTSGVSAIACSSQRACVAVGSQGAQVPSSNPLIESWDGRSWRPVSLRGAPSGTAWFTSVSCVGTFCAAVGGDSAGALTAVGVGTDWRIVPNPASGEGEGAVLNAVSCVSYRWCLTAGVGIGASLLERWNGTTWSAHLLTA